MDRNIWEYTFCSNWTKIENKTKWKAFVGIAMYTIDPGSSAVIFSVSTLFCRSVLAPASSSRKTVSVLLHLAAAVSAEYPSCVMTDMCSET